MCEVTDDVDYLIKITMGSVHHTRLHCVMIVALAFTGYIDFFRTNLCHITTVK